FTAFPGCSTFRSLRTRNKGGRRALACWRCSDESNCALGSAAGPGGGGGGARPSRVERLRRDEAADLDRGHSGVDLRAAARHHPAPSGQAGEEDLVGGAGPSLADAIPGTAGRGAQGRDGGDGAGLPQQDEARGVPGRTHHHRREDDGAALTELWSWLEATPLATGIRPSLWMYPALESAHLLAAGMVVGGGVVLGAGVLGRGTALPMPALLEHVVALVWAGLAVSVTTGLLLFVSHATEQAAKPLLWVKLSLLIAAGVNAWAF